MNPTNIIAATIAVFLHTNVSESFVTPAGDAKAVRAVTEKVYQVRWKEGTNTFTTEFQRVPVATNFSMRIQEWREAPVKIERVPLGNIEKLTPPKR